MYAIKSDCYENIRYHNFFDGCVLIHKRHYNDDSDISIFDSVEIFNENGEPQGLIYEGAIFGADDAFNDYIKKYENALTIAKMYNLLALVTLKYGNLDNDVNSIINDSHNYIDFLKK